MTQTCLVAALEYAENGWWVLPVWWPLADGSCACGEADCESPGKHPIGRLVPHGLHDATTDASVIRGWWQRHPRASVAVRTGDASGLVVLDVDPRHGGDESLADLEAKHGALPETLRSLTGGGGVQVFFAHPGRTVRNSAGELGPGLDVRGDGGYVVLPPSRHASGRTYAWEVAPGETPLASMPVWVSPEAASAGAKSKARDDWEIPEAIERGTRARWLTRLAGAMRHYGMGEEAILAGLLVCNAERCKPPLSERQVRGIAEQIAQKAPGDAWNDGEVHEPQSGELWTWQRILETNFPPVSWLLEPFLPRAGLAILAGKPKVGKSWLTLQFAGALGAGEEMFKRRASRASVLYYCLEDRIPRIKQRGQIQELCADAEVTFTETLHHLDQEGMTELAGILQQVLPEVVIVDTLAAAKSGKVDENAAGEMAALLNGLQRLAHERQILILLVVHQRKSAGDNPLDLIRGSSAIVAAADVVLVLERSHPPYYRLSVTGRDAEDAEYRLEFEDGRWLLMGDARQLARDETIGTLCDALATLGEVAIGAIATYLSWPRSTTQRAAQWAEEANRVTSRVVRGNGVVGGIQVLYRLASDPAGFRSE